MNTGQRQVFGKHKEEYNFYIGYVNNITSKQLSFALGSNISPVDDVTNLNYGQTKYAYFFKKYIRGLSAGDFPDKINSDYFIDEHGKIELLGNDTFRGISGYKLFYIPGCESLSRRCFKIAEIDILYIENVNILGDWETHGTSSYGDVFLNASLENVTGNAVLDDIRSNSINVIYVQNKNIPAPISNYSINSQTIDNVNITIYNSLHSNNMVYTEIWIDYQLIEVVKSATIFDIPLSGDDKLIEIIAVDEYYNRSKRQIIEI